MSKHRIMFLIQFSIFVILWFVRTWKIRAKNRSVHFKGRFISLKLRLARTQAFLNSKTLCPILENSLKYLPVIYPITAILRHDGIFLNLLSFFDFFSLLLVVSESRRLFALVFFFLLFLLQFFFGTLLFSLYRITRA